MTKYAYIVNNGEILKLYDLASGYLGDMPVARTKMDDYDHVRNVYSAECLLNNIEAIGTVRISTVTRETEQYIDNHREDLIP